jgi:hypothetical protein
LVSGWSETLETAGSMILENVPEFTAIVVPMNLYMTPQLWLHFSHTVP